MENIFLVDVNGERFVIYVTDPETIRLALENVKGKNSLFPMGGTGPPRWRLQQALELAHEARDGEDG